MTYEELDEPGSSVGLGDDSQSRKGVVLYGVLADEQDGRNENYLFCRPHYPVGWGSNMFRYPRTGGIVFGGDGVCTERARRFIYPFQESR